MEMETSDDEAEDGQITKFEQEEEKERKLFGIAQPNDGPMTLDDLNKARLTRDSLAKHFLAPWFEEYVKGIACRLAQPVFSFFADQTLRSVCPLSCWPR